MMTKKKAQAPPPSPVRRKEEGTYRFRRSAWARARKSFDRIRNEGEEPLTAGDKVRNAFASMRKGCQVALIMKRAIESEAAGSADTGSSSGKSMTVGNLLRRGSRDLAAGPGLFGSILPEEPPESRPWNQGVGSLGLRSSPQGETSQGRRVSGSNPLLRLSIFGTRTGSTEELQEPQSTPTDDKGQRRRRTRKSKDVDGSGGHDSEVDEVQVGADGEDKRSRVNRRRRRKQDKGKDGSNSDQNAEDNDQRGSQSRHRRRKEKQGVDDGFDSEGTSKEGRRRRRLRGARGDAAPSADGGHDSERSQDERSEDESDSYSYDSADSEDSETASGYAKTLEKRRYLIPNSSEVSLAETAQSSYFLPRCAQKSLSFGRRRSTRRPGVELRQAEAKGLASRRSELELEMCDCLLELQAGCDELSDSAVFGWPGKELVRLHRLCRCAVAGLCGVYKELIAAERPRTPKGLLQEQAQLREMLRLCRKALRRVAELRRLCRSKDWKWLKTPAPWEQLSTTIASPRRSVLLPPKKPWARAPESPPQEPASPLAGLADPSWYSASVESLDLLQNSINTSMGSSLLRLSEQDWTSSTLTGSAEPLRTWNDDFRLFPGFCQDTLQEARVSQNRWSQERERLSLCGPYQTGQCSARCPHGLQHRCVHCRGQHAGKDCRPVKARSVDRQPKKPQQAALEARRCNAACVRKGRMQGTSGGSFKDDLEVCGTMDQRYLQADLIKRASVAVKSLMLLLARLPTAARVDEHPRLAGFVRSFEEHRLKERAREAQGQGPALPRMSFHLRRGMARF